MRRRPTKRSVLIAGIGVLLILAGATAQSGWLFVLAAGVLGLVGGSSLVRHPLAAIVVTRTAPTRLRVGDDVRVGLTLSNTSRRAAPLFTVEDVLPAFEPVRIGVARLAGGGSAEVEAVRTAIRRGRFAGSEVVIASGAPFGLTRSRRRLEVPTTMLVVPRWVPLRGFPLLEPSSSPSDVVHERPRAGGGEEFLGVREYRPGDALRSVHWRSTARARTLVVKEYEQESSSRAALVLTGAGHGEGPGSSFEMLVSACASVGLYAISTGHAVHLIAPRDHGLDQVVDPSADGLLDRLATVQAADIPLEDVVAEALSRIGRRGTVVIFTTSGGATGASLSAAVTLVERAGARAVVVLARSSSWDPKVTSGIPPVPARVATRVIENGKELSACLAG